jgi:hypothetical protein
MSASLPWRASEPVQRIRLPSKIPYRKKELGLGSGVPFHVYSRFRKECHPGSYCPECKPRDRTKTMGFPEAFRNLDDKGRPTLVYVQISQNTFVELQPAGADRPPGISHFGVVVDKMGAATAMFTERGANVSETRASGTKAILSNITDPNGIRMELLELPPIIPIHITRSAG